MSWPEALVASVGLISFVILIGMMVDAIKININIGRK